MSESVTEWMKGVKAALKKNGFSEDNNIALGMASAMLAGRDEKSLSYDEGFETGSPARSRADRVCGRNSALRFFRVFPGFLHRWSALIFPSFSAWGRVRRVASAAAEPRRRPRT